MVSDLLIFVVLLGIFHGVNPGTGWLFAVFKGIFKSKRHIPVAVSVISFGQMLSVVPVLIIFPLLIQYTLYTPLVVGFVVLGAGFFTLVRSHKHPSTGLNVGYDRLLMWGILLGTTHASGIVLLPFFGGAGNMIVLTIAHFLAVVSTMLVMAVLTTYVFKLGIIRKMWVNFDLMWGIALMVIGVGAAFQAFL